MIVETSRIGQFYMGINRSVGKHPKLIRGLYLVNQVVTWFTFLSFPVLLLYFLWQRDYALARAIIVPLDGFVIFSFVRYLINRKRPYESLPIQSAIPKDTKGKSFPSRHVFSAVIIGMLYFLWSPFWFIGIIIFAFSIFLAAVRVLTSIHYISDVVVGAVLGVLCGLIGFIWIP